MLTYILILSIQCLDGFSTTQTLDYPDDHGITAWLKDLEKDNRKQMPRHKRCYVDEASWHTEETRTVENEEQTQ